MKANTCRTLALVLDECFVIKNVSHSRMNRKKEDRLKIHAPAEDSESDTDEEETPEQRGKYP